jgi:hypothetical protein
MNDGQWTMNNEQRTMDDAPCRMNEEMFFVYRLTFIVLTKLEPLPQP